MRKKFTSFGMKAFIVALSVFAICCETRGQGTLTRITFGGPPSFLSGDVVQKYTEAGVVFTATTNQSGYSGFSRRYSGASADYPNNGTTYIQGSPYAPVVVTLATGSPYGLFSVDLAENTKTTPNALTVQFTGYRFDGSSVTNSFTTDGIIGVPGTPDFQTFYFGSTFSSGLTRVEIAPIGASLDNLFVSVPEPSTWALLLVGGGVFAFHGFKRKLTLE